MQKIERCFYITYSDFQEQTGRGLLVNTLHIKKKVLENIFMEKTDVSEFNTGVTFGACLAKNDMSF